MEVETGAANLLSLLFESPRKRRIDNDRRPARAACRYLDWLVRALVFCRVFTVLGPLDQISVLH